MDLLSGLPPNEPAPYTLARFRNGDITELAAVFKLYGARVYRLARKMMGNQADAEDATQEIFVRAFEQARSFDGRSQLFTWLYRLAVRHCLNMIRQRERRASAEHSVSAELGRSGPGSVSIPAGLSEEDQGEVLDRLLQGLPAHYRACLVLREVEGLSYARIAELLEIPTGTVMSRLARARRMLWAAAHAPAETGPPSGIPSASELSNRIEERAPNDLR